MQKLVDRGSTGNAILDSNGYILLNAVAYLTGALMPVTFRSREKTIMKMCDMMETVMSEYSLDDADLDEIVRMVKTEFPEEIYS